MEGRGVLKVHIHGGVLCSWHEMVRDRFRTIIHTPTVFLPNRPLESEFHAVCVRIANITRQGVCRYGSTFKGQQVAAVLVKRAHSEEYLRASRQVIPADLKVGND